MWVGLGCIPIYYVCARYTAHTAYLKAVQQLILTHKWLDWGKKRHNGSTVYPFEVRYGIRYSSSLQGDCWQSMPLRCFPEHCLLYSLF